MDKTKQITLIKGTHVASNLSLQYANALDIISSGQKRPLPGYEHRSKPASSLSFNLRQDSQNQNFFLADFHFFSSLILASGDPEITQHSSSKS